MPRLVFLSLRLCAVAGLPACGAASAHAQQPRAQRPLVQEAPGTALLNRTVARLAALRSVVFEQTLELNYASEDYHQILPSKGHIVFDAAVPVGAQMRFETPSAVFATDGRASFAYDKVQNTLDTTHRATASKIPASHLQGSLYALRHGLAALGRADSAVVVRVASALPGTEVLEIRVLGLNLTPDGTVERLPRPLLLTYRLTVDRASGLPVEFERRTTNGDFMRTSLRVLNARAPRPPRATWSYASLVNVATRAPQRGPTRPLVAAGNEAPAWTLPVPGSPDRLSLSDLRGRPALLVFWTAHCGYSIDAVPAVNALAQQHPGVAVRMVNVGDPEQTVRTFVRRQRVGPPVVYNARAVAEAYGIDGFPTAVLVDAEGRVAYAGGVGAALDAALQRLALR